MMNPQKQMVMSVLSKRTLEHKWANKKRGMRETFINYKMKMREGKGVRKDSLDHIKEAASQQVEAVTDATASLGKGLKKSITTFRKESSRFASSLSEFVDTEDILKSIHQVAHPEEHAKRKTSIIHTPIDCKNYKKPDPQAISDGCPKILDNGQKKEGEAGEKRNRNHVSSEPGQRFQNVEPARNMKNNGKNEQNLSKEHAGLQKSKRYFSSFNLTLKNVEKDKNIATSLSTSSLSLAERNLEEPKILSSSRRLCTSTFSLEQRNMEEQRILSSNRRLSTSTLSLEQRNREEQRFLSNNRRVSTSTLGLAQRNTEEQGILSSKRRVSTSTLSLAQRNLKEQRILSSKR